MASLITDTDRPAVKSLHIAPGSRLPMRSVDAVTVTDGGGIIGDRYENTRHRHLTIQSAEQLREAGDDYGRPIDAGLTRRNITLTHGEIPLKPGTRWAIGDVQLEVVRQAAPCKLLEDTLGPGAKKHLHRRAGAVCRVLTGGTIAVGDLAHPPQEPSD